MDIRCPLLWILCRVDTATFIYINDNFGCGLSQWEKALLRNTVCHWLSTHPAWPLYFATDVGDWTLIYPEKNDAPSFAALKDENRATCAGILTPDGGALLNASISPAYNTVNVSILVSGTDIVFGPNSDPSKCHMATSLLMTHDSSKVTDEKSCSPICDVPGACFIQGREVTPSKQKWFFTCSCPRQSCNELLLVLRSDEGRATVCEIVVGNN